MEHSVKGFSAGRPGGLEAGRLKAEGWGSKERIKAKV
jgi:hypothetical protein